MAGTSSISGLASGLDTTSIISQLMDIEKQPQTLLSTKMSTATVKASAYRAINTSFAALLTAAQKVTAASTWTSTKATSSDTSITATAGATAQTGSLSFTVKQLATAHSIVSAGQWTTTTEDTGLGTSMTLSTSATPITLDTNGDGKTTLAEAVAAINSSSTAGVKASAVNTGSGYKLQLTASSTGLAKVFTATPSGSSAPSFAIATQGQDAKLAVGTTTTYDVTSASNTFDQVLSGTSFTVSQAGASATVTVTSDPSAVTKAVQGLVDAANAALTQIVGYTTASGNDADTDGILSGDYSMKQLKTNVLSAISSAIGGKSAASAGLEVDRYGKITFDSAAFSAALAADPASVQALFQGTVGLGTDNVTGTIDDTIETDGLAARLQQLAAGVTDKVNGTLVVLANGQDDRASDLKDQIAAWDIRLTKREETLTAQFTAMESALSTLNNQASWLTSQLKSLPSWSSTDS